MKTKNILCLGNAVLDQIFSVERLPSTPGKHFASSFMEMGGGPAATASAAIARLGQQATLWSRIGDDPAGDRIAAELTAYGVSLEGCRRITGAVSPLAAVIVDARGERTIVCYNDPGLPQATPDWLPLGKVKNFDCVLADARWPAAAAEVLREAARHGIPTVLDADLTPDQDALPLLVSLADHAVFSEGGLRQYSGEASPEAGLKKAAAQIRGIPYVTMGERGCSWLEKSSTAPAHCPAFNVDVVDTTGAGDVFHGAFALALTEGKEGKEAVRFAAAAAAIKCTCPGGRAGIPGRAQLEDFLRAHA